MFRAFLVFHRWLALIVGVFIVAIALTGAVVVFEGPVVRNAAPKVVPARARLSLDSLAAIAITSAHGGPVGFVSGGDSPDAPYQFGVGQPPRIVEINPYSGAVMPPRGGPTRAETFVRAAHRWHTRLTGGKIGEAIVILATYSACILALTGLVLWWREKIWRVNLSGSWKRANFDLHHALGFIATPAILIMTLTGMWMAGEGTITPVVERLNHTRALPPPQPATHDPSATPVLLDSVAMLARTSIPDATISNMQLQPSGLVRVQMKHHEDHTPAGRSYVFVDRYRGTVLRAADTRTAEAGTRLKNLQRSLHTGDVFGLPTQVIWFLSALVLASQGLTGVLMWWNGRRARQAQSERAVT
jgi:uncharacterized iron-regulated membrane protein